MNKFKRMAVAAAAAITVAAGATTAIAAPAQATVRYGTINCSGGNVVGAWIDQSGNSGWANWNYTGPGSANWNYNFNNNSYRIKVGCGGSSSSWAYTNVSAYSNPNVGSWDYICYNTYGICYKS